MNVWKIKIRRKKSCWIRKWRNDEWWRNDDDFDGFNEKNEEQEESESETLKDLATTVTIVKKKQPQINDFIVEK